MISGLHTRTLISTFMTCALLSPGFAQSVVPEVDPGDVRSFGDKLGYDKNDLAYLRSCFATYKKYGPKGVADRIVSDLCGCKTEALQDNQYYQSALESMLRRKVQVNFFVLEGVALASQTPEELNRVMAKLDDSAKIVVQAIAEATGKCMTEIMDR
jgi:hypothetical protein